MKAWILESMPASRDTDKPDKTAYADAYRDVDFRKHPELYRIGRGEQGVLMAQPYKGEILPHWKFRTPEVAEVSARAIYAMFEDYKAVGDFIGMDMARKFLQMGFTRARRYANHPSGHKYTDDGQVARQSTDWATSEKAQSAAVFYKWYSRAKDDAGYLAMKQLHRSSYEKPEGRRPSKAGNSTEQ